MGLSNLFDIVYSDESTKIELDEMMNNIKIETFMDCHNMNSQFVLVACKNIVYNKTYNNERFIYELNLPYVAKLLEYDDDKKLIVIINDTL